MVTHLKKLNWFVYWEIWSLLKCLLKWNLLFIVGILVLVTQLRICCQLIFFKTSIGSSEVCGDGVGTGGCVTGTRRSVTRTGWGRGNKLQCRVGMGTIFEMRSGDRDKLLFLCHFLDSILASCGRLIIANEFFLSSTVIFFGHLKVSNCCWLRLLLNLSLCPSVEQTFLYSP